MKNSLEAGKKMKYFWGRLLIREEIASLETMADGRWQKALNNQEQLFGAGTEDKRWHFGVLKVWRDVRNLVFYEEYYESTTQNISLMEVVGRIWESG